MKESHFDLTGRVAVVTGSARGIGQAIGERLAAAGATVVGGDLEHGADVSFEQRTLDVTSEESVRAFHAGVVADHGTLDIQVCSAGIVGRNAFAWETSLDEWSKVLEVNLTGTWLCNREALATMRTRGYGRIVNIASIAGKEGNPKLGPYSASKAAVIGMTKSLAKEVAAEGDVRLASVAPAVIHTPMLDQVTKETVDYMVSKIPVGRTGRPEEVAALVHYLVSPECSFSTGACWDISGGRATY